MWIKFPNLSKSASGTGKLANCHKTHHVCVQPLRKYFKLSPLYCEIDFKTKCFLYECNFLSENKLVAEAGKHHIGKQKGEQLFTLPTFRTFHRQAIA